MPAVSAATGMQPLRVALVQGATRWHDAPANRDYYGALVRQAGDCDLVVLSTGVTPAVNLAGHSTMLLCHNENPR